MDENNKQFLTFKGKPLVRSGNIIFYGSLSDPYVIMMQILDTIKFKDMEKANNISIQLQLTDPDVPATDRIVKQAEKIGLFAAMDIADIWLERAITQQ